MRRSLVFLPIVLLACAKPASDTRIAAAMNVVEITGFDYAFTMPDSLPPGPTAFHFTNTGKVDHKFNIVLLKPSSTLAQFIAAANTYQPTGPLLDGAVGVLFAKPNGKSASTLSVNLLPVRTYAVQCINQNSDSAPTHRQMGMFKSLRVTNGDGTANKPVVTDTIIGLDYAYKFSHTAAPGLHHFVFINGGQQSHEINIAWLKSGVTVQQVLALASKGGNPDKFFDKALGVLHAPRRAASSQCVDDRELQSAIFQFLRGIISRAAAARLTESFLASASSGFRKSPHRRGASVAPLSMTALNGNTSTRLVSLTV